MSKNIVSQVIWTREKAETLWLYAYCMLPLYRTVCLIEVSIN